MKYKFRVFCLLLFQAYDCPGFRRLSARHLASAYFPYAILRLFLIRFRDILWQTNPSAAFIIAANMRIRAITIVIRGVGRESIAVISHVIGTTNTNESICVAKTITVVTA